MSKRLANGVSTILINGKPILINVPRMLPRNQPHCIVLEICVFNNFILAYELAITLQIFALRLPVSNKLCGKLVSSLYLSIIFDDNLKVTSTRLFVIDFICEVVNLIT